MGNHLGVYCLTFSRHLYGDRKYIIPVSLKVLIFRLNPTCSNSRKDNAYKDTEYVCAYIHTYIYIYIYIYIDYLHKCIHYVPSVSRSGFIFDHNRNDITTTKQKQTELFHSDLDV